MSTALAPAPYHSNHYSMLDAMTRPLRAYHEPFSPGQGFYLRDQLPQPPLETQQQQPRLPPMTAMISAADQALPPSHLRDPYGAKPGHYSDYATPSPVGQTPPQFSYFNSDVRATERRQADSRRSPTLSSTASDRSSDELPQEMRLQQKLRESRPERTWPPQHMAPQQRSELPSFEGHQLPGSGRPPATAYAHVPQMHLHGSQATRPSHSSPVLYQASRSASPRPEIKSMSISNLISQDDSTPNTASTSRSSMAQPPPYQIRVRQQPHAARSCGFGERDRRVIDPPPIVELVIDDPSLTPEKRDALISQKCLVVHCSIWDESGKKDMSTMPEDYRQQRRLMGTVVSSSFIGQDEQGQPGCFFCFQDLSCRTPGTFRLRFAFVMIDPTATFTGANSPIASMVMSEPFTVYNAKDFPGMQASTPLTRRLKEQGCLISIKKGNDKGGSERGQGRDDTNDDEEEEEEESKPRKRRKTKTSS